VRDDASLQQVTSLPASSSTWVWEDACVVCTDVPTQAEEEEEDEPETALYLVGAWPRVLIDPSVWGSQWPAVSNGAGRHGGKAEEVLVRHDGSTG
jgi:hypothetical protein